MVQTTHETAAHPAQRSLPHWLTVGGGAPAVGTLVWVIAHPLLGIDLRTGSGAHPTTVGLPSVIVVSIVVATAGYALRRMLSGRANATRTWTVIAAVVLLLSLLGPLGARTAAAGVALAALHLAVGGTVITGVRRAFGPGRSAGTPS